LCSRLFLAGRSGGSLGETSAHRLLYPDHVGEVCPIRLLVGVFFFSHISKLLPVPWVVDGTRTTAVLPANWTVLLKEALER
jgi:hypothetical protein